MEKILNLLFFVGTLLRQLAKFLAPTMPSFKDLKEANSRNKLIAALENEIKNDGEKEKQLTEKVRELETKLQNVKTEQK